VSEPWRSMTPCLTTDLTTGRSAARTEAAPVDTELPAAESDSDCAKRRLVEIATPSNADVDTVLHGASELVRLFAEHTTGVVHELHAPLFVSDSRTAIRRGTVWKQGTGDEVAGPFAPDTRSSGGLTDFCLAALTACTHGQRALSDGEVASAVMLCAFSFRTAIPCCVRADGRPDIHGDVRVRGERAPSEFAQIIKPTAHPTPPPVTTAAVATTRITRAGLSQAELAERAGVAQSVISVYESGRRQPALQTLAALVEATGFDLDVRTRIGQFDRTSTYSRLGVSRMGRSDVRGRRGQVLTQARLTLHHVDQRVK
jgi:DNA-binding XRE family transcriptional regulator